MSSFTRALEKCSNDYRASIAISAEQIEATVTLAALPPCEPRFDPAGLRPARDFPVSKDDLELARKVNEFLAERPAL